MVSLEFLTRKSELLSLLRLERVIFCHQPFARAIAFQRSFQTPAAEFICVIFCETVGSLHAILHVDDFFKRLAEIVIKSVFGDPHVISNQYIGIFGHPLV